MLKVQYWPEIIWRRFVGLSSIDKFTFLLMIFTGFLMLFTGFLAFFTWELVDDGRVNQRASVTVSELKIERRILNAHSKMKPGPDKVLVWLITPIIKNSGNTPTENLRYLPIHSCADKSFVVGFGQHFAVCPPNYPASMVVPYDPEELASIFPPNKTHPFISQIGTLNGPVMAVKNGGTFLKAVVGPQTTMPTGLGGIGVPEAFLENPNNSDFKWYLYGIVYYDDVFSLTKQHVLKYCFVITSIMDESGKPEPSYHNCLHWNCMDNECKKDRQEYDEENPEGSMQLQNYKAMINNTTAPIPQQ